ncbi:DnaJ domain-containing protein [Nocardioides anomalus]|uniref:DnaJ domain-containing protein n=1 Tax=Nocardioides anomalus TaxID=2712223 RepID=A0A6G6W859_9ACTN|nr:DnaJ domain-containing protein [Nocardioides anomalus]QIG41406.1 DnaJ domain-containing protein [Nocardioides anomalus]
MTPTWYDLLGVDRDATAAEIRTAWRDAIADLDPGDRRFRSLNEAAEVLLDPQRRAAYDATLEPEPEPATAPEPEPADEETARPLTHDEPGGRRPTWVVPAWLLAALAVLLALVLGCAAYLLTQPSDDDIAEASSQAQGAAETAVTTILAYDYRHLDDDQQAAGELMTASYRAKYDELFTVIKQNAAEVKPVVTVQVVASGIVRSGDDRVQVLVFVNRPTTNAKTTEPVVSRDQVVMTMVKQGDAWLVDGLDTSQLAG